MAPDVERDSAWPRTALVRSSHALRVTTPHTASRQDREPVQVLVDAGRAEVDADGRVIGVHGLTLRATRHAFEMGSGARHSADGGAGRITDLSSAAALGRDVWSDVAVLDEPFE